MTFGGLRVAWVSALIVLAWALCAVSGAAAGSATAEQPLWLALFVFGVAFDAALAWVDALLWAGIVAEWRWRRQAVMRGEAQENRC